MTNTITMLAVLTCFLHILDVHSTNLVLDRGGWEKNKGVRILMRHFGSDWWKPKLIIGFGGSAVLWYIGVKLAHIEFLVEPVSVGLDVFALVCLLLICAVYTYVVRNNYRIAEKMDRE